MQVALCTAHDQIATADMVCTEYSEIYCLTKEALMEVVFIILYMYAYVYVCERECV